MRYVTYTRTADGIVSRTHGRVVMPSRERAADYPHRERLQGWPERSVYWTRSTGAALGLAPLR
jgi:hypothetical protein